MQETPLQQVRREAAELNVIKLVQATALLHDAYATILACIVRDVPEKYRTKLLITGTSIDQWLKENTHG